jgi:hypothetical protein
VADRITTKAYYDLMDGIVKPINDEAPLAPMGVVESIASRAKWALEQHYLEIEGRPTIPGGSAYQLDVLRSLCRDFLSLSTELAI